METNGKKEPDLRRRLGRVSISHRLRLRLRLRRRVRSGSESFISQIGMK
jgi:hypothetical protein